MLSKDYILGFIEGEGCFSILIQKTIDRKPRLGIWKAKKKNPYLFRISLTFRIANSAINLPLLEEIKSTLGFGSIYIQKRNENNKRASNVAYFYTKSVLDAQKAREFFSTLTFRSTKGKDFATWCKVLELIEQKKHLSKEGILEICTLRDQMNFRPTKNKWNTEEVRKVFEENPEHITAHVDPNQSHLLHNNNSHSSNWLEKKQGNSKPNAFTPVSN